ncbi:hypothetical protein GCM10025868_29040 [Angustibacter aerolatus]|uniref:Uncharacterized protein n=1 Tax=Angustibacter aerolatus TaxID=1162965 RepID=A0ABQ6JJT5_9ACTN|nr:hypothetical protein GCM10025868_29040 [Angustibacter aerolatus]
MPVQASLADAYRRLDGTPFTRPTSFRVTRLDHYSRLHGAAPLDLDPEPGARRSVRPRRHRPAAAAPAPVPGLYSASGSLPVLTAQEQVEPWLVGVLRGQRPGHPVPPDVRRAFAVVERCTPVTTDLP